MLYLRNSRSVNSSESRSMFYELELQKVWKVKSASSLNFPLRFTTTNVIVWTRFELYRSVHVALRYGQFVARGRANKANFPRIKQTLESKFNFSTNINHYEWKNIIEWQMFTIRIRTAVCETFKINYNTLFKKIYILHD